MSNVCPISFHRPVISIEKSEKFCMAYVDNSTHGITDLTFPIKLLTSLNFDKAYEIS